MLKLKNNMIKKFDRSIPNVNFDNNEVLWNLANLVDIDMNVYQYFGLLFLRFGFEPEDNLLLLNYCKDDNSFDCVLNKNGKYGNYRIQLKKNDDQIFVSHNNVIYGYVCEKIPYGELGMRVSLGSYTYEYADGMIFSRYLSRDKAKFLVSMCGRKIELEFRKPDDITLPMFDENGVYAKYKLDCEEELSKYMTLLSNFNKSIIDIYNELCEYYLGDICRYPEFILKISEIEEDEVINLIHLKNGNLEKFEITNERAMVFVDKDDNSFVELLSQREYPVKFSMSYQDKIETYSFSPLDSVRLKDYTSNGISRDIDLAYEELLDVNVKVKKLFNRGSK